MFTFFLLSCGNVWCADWGSKEKYFESFYDANPFAVLKLAVSSSSDSCEESEEDQPGMREIEEILNAWLDEDDKDNDGSWTTVGVQKKGSNASSKLRQKRCFKKSSQRIQIGKPIADHNDRPLIRCCHTILESHYNSSFWYAELTSSDVHVMQNFLNKFYAHQHDMFSLVDAETGVPGNFAHALECILLVRPWYDKAQYDKKSYDVKEILRKETWKHIQEEIEKYPLQSITNPMTQLIRLILTQRYGDDNQRAQAYDALNESLIHANKRKEKYVDYEHFNTVIQNYLHSHVIDEYLRKGDKVSPISSEDKEKILKAIQGLGDLAKAEPLSAYYFLIYFYHNDLHGMFKDYIVGRGGSFDAVQRSAASSLQKIAQLGFGGAFRYPFVDKNYTSLMAGSEKYSNEAYPYAFIQNLNLDKGKAKNIRDLIRKNQLLKMKKNIND